MNRWHPWNDGLFPCIPYQTVTLDDVLEDGVTLPIETINIYDNSHLPELVRKFKQRFLNRYITSPSVPEWLLFFQRVLDEQLAEMNHRYRIASVEIEPLITSYNKSLTIGKDTNTASGTSLTENQSNSITDIDNHSISESNDMGNEIRENYTDTDGTSRLTTISNGTDKNTRDITEKQDTTGSTSEDKTTTGNTTTKGDALTVNDEYPNVQLGSIPDNNYADSSTKADTNSTVTSRGTEVTEGDSNSVKNTTGKITDDGSNHNETTATGTKTDSTTGGGETNTSSNGNIKADSYGKNDTVTTGDIRNFNFDKNVNFKDWIVEQKGRNGRSAMELMIEYRTYFEDVDRLFLDKMEELFLPVLSVHY